MTSPRESSSADECRNAVLYVFEDAAPQLAGARWCYSVASGQAPGFEDVDQAVAWGLERAATVIIRTPGSGSYYAGREPAPLRDGTIYRPWSPSAADRAVIDAQYAAAVADVVHEVTQRGTYEAARAVWLRDHAPSIDPDSAYSCHLTVNGLNSIDFEEFDPAGALCGARRRGTGRWALASAEEVLRRASDVPDGEWVQAVVEALARDRSAQGPRRPSLEVRRATAESFHVSASVNRESIRRHGLDWRRMGAAPGIAGSTRPEAAGVFVCLSEDETDFYVRMSRQPCDVWAANVQGWWLESGPHGWWLVCRPIEAARLRLVSAGLQSTR